MAEILKYNKNRMQYPVFLLLMIHIHWLLKGKSWFYQFCHSSCPSRLMGSSYATSVVTVEVFKESNIISEVFIIIELWIPAVERPLPMFIL